MHRKQQNITDHLSDRLIADRQEVFMVKSINVGYVIINVLYKKATK